MTQEEKSIFLKDLSARLPYGVKYQDRIEGGIHILSLGIIHHYERFIPYLRPMSSMTEEEERELRILWNEDLIGERSPFYIYPCYSKTLDFYNSHHFDYRGLIKMGLALEAPNEIYNN